MRKKIVAGNWKMNKNYSDGLKLASEIINIVNDEVTGDVITILIPSYIHLNSVSKLLEGNNKIFLGAQNCSFEEKGAYTGEISADMLRSCGVKYIIIGHSERRKYFYEDDKLLAKKISIVLKNELIPIFCCGELLQEREQQMHFDVVAQQLEKSLFNLDSDGIKKVIIAYEPVWAIGTGVNANLEQAQEMHAYIRGTMEKKFGKAIAENIPILYGGSCTAANASSLFSAEDVDGGLIGGASLKSREFVDIIKSI